MRVPYRFGVALGLLALPLVMIAAAHGAGRAPGALPARLAAKLDTRLVGVAMSGDPAPVPVWLTFADKGEDGTADLVSHLAAAAAALTERARARRLRARVTSLVDYDDLPVAADYLRELRERGFTIVAHSRWLNRAAVRVPGGRLAELAELPFVARIIPVARAHRSADPPPGGDLPVVAASPAASARARHSMPAPPVDYGRTRGMLEQMNVPAVHDSGYTGAGVLVCILDTGFNHHDKHEALRDVPIAPGMTRDFARGDTLVTDTTAVFGFRHGTQVMGCVAGNLAGAYVGSGFGAQFALARTEVEPSETPTEMLYWGMGAEWADSLGAEVISSSLGYFTFDDPADDYTYADMNGRTTDVSRAAQIAAAKGILVVNAVGNEGISAWRFLIAPSDVSTDSLIAVGAVDSFGVVASFSSYGPSAAGCFKPDLAARGAGNTLVSTTGNPNLYTSGSGTSFATPLVAGLAACLLQARPAWPATLIARALRETASRAGSPDNRVGWGIPDGLAALRWVPDQAVAPPPLSGLGLRLIGPNPFHLGGEPARVAFALDPGSRPGMRARVRVLDVQGREVRELYSGAPGCLGTVSVSWDGRRGDGAAATPGLYLISLEAAGERRGVRAILLP